MAAKHIDARAAARNTLDYPLEQDTPGANPLVVREREWWAQPATPGAKMPSLPVVTELYPVPAPLPRTTTQTFADAPPLHPQVQRRKEAAYALPWWVALFLAFFALGVVSYEAVVSPGHSLGFHLTRDFVAGFIFGNAALVAAACWRHPMIYRVVGSTLLIGGTALVLALSIAEALR